LPIIYEPNVNVMARELNLKLSGSTRNVMMKSSDVPVHDSAVVHIRTAAALYLGLQMLMVLVPRGTGTMTTPTHIVSVDFPVLGVVARS
jgi:hypothetical protein